ncbi:iron-sulfur cluster repair di-iron protein [bacterium]|jgi:regulator of cell morphogenesis and NO signaling|nr:iron-sulfur cluster repair di-iron protein [Balneola sp.]MBR9917674.1 iron-sulfur cluster repair di-iron protein [bacterium]
MKELAQRTVGEIVAEDYRASQIFRSRGMDFCCGGKKTLSSVCEAKNIELDEVLGELNLLQDLETEQHNFNDWNLDFLVDYIVQNHHNFVRKMLPELNFYAEKVARVHGSNHPELIEIFDKVKKLSYELIDHLEKEEEDLFPQIKDLVQLQKIGSVKESLLDILESEHEQAGELMAEIESLTDNFTPPEGACASYRVLFQNLEGFQKDLHKHVHLENNILFPKAMQLEARMN